MSYYESCGFEKSHRVKIFTDNYDHAMFDGDIQLVDMVYLKKDLTAKAINDYENYKNYNRQNRKISN